MKTHKSNKQKLISFNNKDTKKDFAVLGHHRPGKAKSFIKISTTKNSTSACKEVLEVKEVK